MAAGDDEESRQAARQGRLLARPRSPTTAGATGLHRLDLDGRRAGLLYVPPGYQASHPAPLALMLHGAGGHAQHSLNPLMPLADEAGLILLAPDSRGQTWDIVRGGYGPDVAFVDRALAQTFAHYAVDPAHLAIEGFSDGASYALSLGLTNGDLFSHVLAFSPGFMVSAAQRGRPRIFVSHGAGDDVLPIEMCSRHIVPQLRQAGYDVTYREFDGPHTVPVGIADAALDLFLAPYHADSGAG